MSLKKTTSIVSLIYATRVFAGIIDYMQDTENLQLSLINFSFIKSNLYALLQFEIRLHTY